MRKRTRRYITGIAFILTGIVLNSIFWFGLIQITPEFGAEHPALIKLWVTGAEIGSFLRYLVGKSSVVFGFLLIYSGYLLLRYTTRLKKILLVMTEIVVFLTLLYLFSFSSGDSQGRGGIIGRFLISVFKPVLPRWTVYALLITLLSGMIFLLLKHPIWIIKNTLIKKIGKKRTFDRHIFQQEPSSKGEIQEPEGVFKEIIEDNGIHTSSFKSIRSILRSLIRSERKKPPLIRKVILDENGIPIEDDKNDSEIKYQFKQANLLSEKEKINLRSERTVMGSNEETQLLLYEEKNREEENLEMKNGWIPPKTSFLKKSQPINIKHLDRETSRKARDLEKTLGEFGIEARVVNIIRGPVITRYELQPAPGVKLSRIVNLSDNIALSLSASGVRIEAPIPGQSAVGIEIPNIEREMVTLGDIIEKVNGGSGELPLILGKDISGRVVTADLASMPHLLIAGATGSGKSVCVNSLIVSLLYKKSPKQVRFLMIDPKMVELKIYNGIPHLLTEVVTDSRDAGRALRWVLREMEHRYRLLDEAIVRDIRGYNQKSREKLPYIIIIVDEFANLMAISQKDVEDAVVRLAAMSRAVGIHLIMATQRPSVDVITGLIKANFPYRIAFQVASKTDSRTILDTAGAEKLLGRGDMLFSPAGAPAPIRIQGAYISEEEVIKIVEELKRKELPEYIEDIFGEQQGESEEFDGEDPIFNDAVEIVLKTKRASASFLQRRLRIGYNRAARLIELMEEKGIIGPPRGSKPREIFIDN